jgi:glutathione synthetase
MPLRVACQMDPIERIDIRGDSTFAVLLEAQRRGHNLFYYTPPNLALHGDRLLARGATLKVEDKVGANYKLSRPRVEDLSKRDVVLLRQDPPFDMAYITTTHLLERIHPKTLVVNDPAHVRNAPEKVFVLDFLDLMPPTLVTRALEDVLEFRARYEDIILKPLYGNGGAAIFRAPTTRTWPPGRAVPDGLPRAVHGAAVPPRDQGRRQAHHPRRRRGRGRHKPPPARGRDALEPARRRHGEADQAHRAR